MGSELAKRCTKCGETKSVHDFSPRHWRCRSCEAACAREYRAGLSEERRAQLRAKQSEYAKRERLTHRGRERERNRGAARRGRHDYVVRHAAIAAKLAKKNIDELSDRYVKSRICAHGSGIKMSQVSPELIALKREQLSLQRLAKKLRQAITEQQEQTA